MDCISVSLNDGVLSDLTLSRKMSSARMREIWQYRSWFGFPDQLDGFVWCFEAESLDLFGEIVGNQPVTHMFVQFDD